MQGQARGEFEGRGIASEYGSKICQALGTGLRVAMQGRAGGDSQ